MKRVPPDPVTQVPVWVKVSLCGSVLVGELAPDLGCSFRRAFPTTMGIGRGFKLGVKGRGLTAREGISSLWTAQALEAQSHLFLSPLRAVAPGV